MDGSGGCFVEFCMGFGWDLERFWSRFWMGAGGFGRSLGGGLWMALYAFVGNFGGDL